MRILVISDIHGNIDALEAVVAAEPQVDRVLCLGDIVDYGPAPDAAVKWVREHAASTVRGNHDHAMGLDQDCRSAPMFHRLAVWSRRRTASKLTEDERHYLGSLPLREQVELDGMRIVLVHATPADPLFRYLPASDVAAWQREVAGLGADLLLVGHTHTPILVDLGSTRLLNPGSVGLPRSGDPRASYALIVDGEPELKRVAYDIGKNVRRLWQCGLPHDVARSLETIYTVGELPATSGPAHP
ncbi:MAG TPA: YfcE family phosphodiesterase [Anaeromyxobacteraceae bacterium]|nr:YfcE family phosphodiesterase [Anaeromyxobacteraceae bacterium]